jgi:hypothetical protein
MYLFVALFTFACVVKPLSGLIVPVVLLIMFKQGLKKFVFLSLTGIATFMFTTFPFWGITAPVRLFEQLRSSYDVYPYSSLNTYNFWGAFGFWVEDSRTFIGSITAEEIAQQLMAGSLLFVLIFTKVAVDRHKEHAYMFYTLGSSLCILLGVTFASRMHERYLYHFFPFLLIFVALYYGKRLKEPLTFLYKPWTILFYLLGVLHFLNLYYVYVQYLFFGSSVPDGERLYHWLAYVPIKATESFPATSILLSWAHVILAILLVVFSFGIMKKPIRH